MKRFISIILMFFVLTAHSTPSLASNKVEYSKYDVYIHKILMSAQGIDKHPKDKVYDPSKAMSNGEIKNFFNDQKAKEIKGIYFFAVPLNLLAEPDEGDSFDHITPEYLEDRFEDFFKPIIIEGWQEAKKNGSEESLEDFIKGNFADWPKGRSTGDPSNPLKLELSSMIYLDGEGNVTDDSELVQDWVIFEFEELSIYDEYEITGSKALPMVLHLRDLETGGGDEILGLFPNLHIVSLPIEKSDGTIMEKAHLYPKNAYDPMPETGGEGILMMGTGLLLTMIGGYGFRKREGLM